MRTETSIFFRERKQKVSELLSPDLRYLIPSIMDDAFTGNQPNILSQCTVLLSKEQVDQFLRWRRDDPNSRFLLISIILDDQYDPEELLQAPALEIRVSDDVEQEDDVEFDCTVDNDYTAFTGWWDCDHCMRIRWLQTDDLEVTLPREHDFQRSTLGQWFVAERLAGLLQLHGVVLRPLKNRDDYLQVVSGPIAVRSDLPPVIADRPCPHCGRPQWILREDVIEDKHTPGYEGITMIRRWSAFTLVSDKFVPAFGHTNLTFTGVQYNGGRPPHYVGQPTTPREQNLFVDLTTIYRLVSQALYRDLIQAKATGIQFKAVNAPVDV